MPSAYEPRCRICNSPHRTEVERWLADGMSTRAVAAELRRRYGEEISGTAVQRHARNHFPLREEIVRQYQESQALLERAAAGRVDEVRLLDEQMREAAELRRAYAEWMNSVAASRERLPTAVVQAYAAAEASLRQTAKTKAELLGNDPESRKADAVASWLDLVLRAEEDGDAGDAR